MGIETTNTALSQTCAQKNSINGLSNTFTYLSVNNLSWCTIVIESHDPRLWIKNHTFWKHAPSSAVDSIFSKLFLQNISLSCTVECAPLCSIQWLKDGQVIDAKNERYNVTERKIEPQGNRNDFEATESTLVRPSVFKY